MTAPASIRSSRRAAPATTVDMFNASVERHGSARALGVKKSGAWRFSTYRELGDQVARLRGGLASLGVTSGDRVALVSDNRLEWAVIAHAVAGLGAALVPIGQAQSYAEQRFILSDSGAKIVFCGTNGVFERLADLPGELAALEQRVGLELPMSQPSAFLRLLERGRENPQPVAEIDPESTACILYTSGTTASPKGVVLSHRSICSNVEALLDAVPLRESDTSLSVLPWSLSFGYTCELHLMMRLGATVALSSGVDQLFSELSEIQPTMLVAVPQLLQQLYDQIEGSVRGKPQMIRTLLETGLSLSRARETRKLKLGERITLEAAERTVMAPLRQRFGGRLRYIFCGGATLSTEIASRLADLGLPVYEGYGLTEAGPVVTANRPGAVRIGTVGRPLAGVSVTIDRSQGAQEGEGEVLVSGPSLMAGYHGLPEATAEALDDGTLRTGDLGFVDADGYLHITGRLREEYKLANGKHVVPSRLERELRMSPYVRAAVVTGEGREHNVAIIVPDVDALSRWASERNLHFPNTAAMLESPRVKSHLMAEIGEQSASFRAYERIRDILLVAETLNAEGGMLSTSQQVRRAAMLDKYAERVAALYD